MKALAKSEALFMEKKAKLKGGRRVPFIEDYIQRGRALVQMSEQSSGDLIPKRLGRHFARLFLIKETSCIIEDE
ncbi:hypothetical protein [Halalkalibacterium ligniniphilum]|uniref:hypothetical protein n=1 Tax=Halalkalibacterium ligniniphilum TaxID=1134413 RepID=UPI000344B559|nr:hypothetical protein [Halalkalibacterium ligniniphilum]